MPPKKGNTARKVDKTVPVESIKHKDKRVNIPTEELRGFVADEEKTPKTMLYPRDPSLDPQLVWKGKDEQDREDLKVPVVPIYIQEKIHPQVIVENLKQEAKKEVQPAQGSLFSDFNGIKFEDLIDFYKHESNWTNRMILGDSLLVMTSLAEKEGLKGKVQCIYFDPPYGIGFRSNWQVTTRTRDVREGKIEGATQQPEQIRAFRDTWKLGIHSYLAYMRDRLITARELLTETGSIFIQIGDENVHLVRCILDEIFGADNFVSQIVFTKAAGGLQAADRVGSVLDHLLWYSKNSSTVKYRALFQAKSSPIESGYTQLLLSDGTSRSMTKEERSGQDPLPSGSRPYMTVLMTKPGPGAKFDVSFDGKKYNSGNRWWGTTPEGIQNVIRAKRVAATDSSLRFITYFDDFPYSSISNLWSGFGGAANPVYVVQTNTEIITRCLLMTTDPGDLVFDPTCGSGSTAYVAEQWGRRWITCDTSRVALALSRTRLMSARFPYYLLADSTEGIRKEIELTGNPNLNQRTEKDIRKGFVYKRVPHVTLASVANNQDIKDKMSQSDIEKAIAKNASVELLFDQPYEESKKVRVTGAFTFESLSPHRVISPDVEVPKSEQESETNTSGLSYEAMIIENLKKAGVQNTIKNERLKFDTLEPFAGRWIQARGDYTDSDGKSKRVAVAIGAEYGTVGSDLLKEAAKEAVQGLGFDVLVVCGFAFDPHVSEEAKRYGKLTILPAKMSMDLHMGDELLKKTGSGNLFMVFGEPDIDLQKQKDGQFVAEIKGVDVYDPTTGQIRSSTTDEIACWFVDTDYNGESFFVRHAYFTGANDPYDKLKRALRAEIDESAWSSLYSTKSQAFPKPKSGKVAVKVINHYGDEVLKVFEI